MIRACALALVSAALALIAPIGSAAASGAIVGDLCDQAVAAVDRLVPPPDPRTEAATQVATDVAEARDRLEAAADALDRLREVEEESTRCAAVLADLDAGLSGWADAVLVAAGVTDDGAAGLVVLAQRLNPGRFEAGIPAGCLRAARLVEDGSFAAADSLLDALAETDEASAECATQVRSELATERSRITHPLVRADDSIRTALSPTRSASTVAVAGAVAGLWAGTAVGAVAARRIDRRIPSRSGRDAERARARGTAIGLALVVGLVSLLFLPLAYQVLVVLPVAFATGFVTLRRPGLAIREFALDEGAKEPGPKAFAAAVVAELHELTEAPCRGVDMMASSDVTESTVETVNIIPGGGSLVAAALAMARSLLPSGQLGLDGSFQRPEPGVQEVSVRLTRGRMLLDSARLSTRMFVVDPGSGPSGIERDRAFEDLATAVAAWVMFRLREHAPPESDNRLYGARAWQSVAYNAVASRRQGVAELDVVTELLNRAADVDPDNQSVVFARISLRSRAIDGSESDAEQRYRAVAAQLARMRQDRFVDGVEPDDPLQWRIRYSLCATLANEAAAALTRRVTTGETAGGRNEMDFPPPAHELLIDALRVLVRRATGQARQPDDTELWERLRALAEPLESIARPESAPQTLARGRRRADMSPREALNWACAELAPTLRGPGEDVPERLEALERHVRLLAKSREQVTRIRQDPFFQLWLLDAECRESLLAWIEEGRPEPDEDSVRAFYACLEVADQLEGLGVRSIDDLPGRLDEVEVALDDPDRVERLRHLVELREAGLSTRETNVVEVAGLRRGEVRGLAFEALDQRVTEACGALGIEPPDAGDLRRWRYGLLRVERVAGTAPRSR